MQVARVRSQPDANALAPTSIRNRQRAFIDQSSFGQVTARLVFLYPRQLSMCKISPVLGKLSSEDAHHIHLPGGWPTLRSLKGGIPEWRVATLLMSLASPTQWGAPSFAFFAKGGSRKCRRQVGLIACPQQNQIAHAASPPTLAKNARMGHPSNDVHKDR